jgi:hypothetical protein
MVKAEAYSGGGRDRLPGWARLATGLLALALLAGCGMSRLPKHLSRAMFDQPDPEIVRDGAPAYLIMLDALIAAEPDNPGRLAAAAQLYSLYGTNFVDDAGRRRRLAGRAREYGRRVLCAGHADLCDLQQRPFDDFRAGLNDLQSADDVPALYAMTVGWLAWIESHRDDWGAIADLPKVEATLRRIVFLDEGYRGGAAHDLLGILLTLRPAALGGQPEEGRRHFERALALSGGRNLRVKVDFARCYARLTYDRELHDRLLHEVLEADPQVPGLTLTNTLAQRQARVLLESADGYF